MFWRGYPCHHIWAHKLKNRHLKPGSCGLIGSFPFYYHFILIDLWLICNISVHRNSCWEYCDFLSFMTDISLFQTSSCMPVLLWLCLLQWIQWDKAKSLSTSPWLPLTFGWELLGAVPMTAPEPACIAWAWLANAKNHFLTLEVAL